MSNFKSDLSSEHVLSKYLDDVYRELQLEIKRVSDIENQNKGIDIIIEYGNKLYLIDEKAQLHYLNKELPTFAFELSYLRNKSLKKGWLLDSKKETEYYFLVTNIKLNNEKNTLRFKEDIASVKITSVNREKLIGLLEKKGLDKESLNYLIYSIREDNAFGRHAINEIDSINEGNIHFSGSLAEQPINMVLKLEYLVSKKIAKVIYPRM